MRISGFTISRNAIKFGYPVKESILSILPICDEFIVNVGKSEDNTLEIIKSINSRKIKIIEREWDDSIGQKVLDIETDFTLKECQGDWCFYIQSDEVIHEKDLFRLKRYMLRYVDNYAVEGFKLRWLHFYGSFYRYRIDPPWFQKQIRIVRNNSNICSHDGAWGFRKNNGDNLKVIKTPCFVYHYGWVNEGKIMAARRRNAERLGYAQLGDNEKNDIYDFGDLSRFPIYFGTHPKVIQDIIKKHSLSVKDWHNVKKKYFWSPLLWFRIRYKTFLRTKHSIPL